MFGSARPSLIAGRIGDVPASSRERARDDPDERAILV
jgi:hypothetical protein